jgi:hypothetical protein
LLSEKLVNFRADEELYNELKMLALKERTTVKGLITDLVAEYVKNHKDGNPQFKLDQFNDPDFIACPAFYRSPTDWENYIKKADVKEKEKLKNQIIAIDKKLGMYL